VTALERVSAQAPDVAAILARHFALMRSQTPEESCHVLPAEAMAAPDIALFALRKEGRPVAIGALRLMGRQGELKSMHTLAEARGRGFGRQILRGLMDEARRMGLTEVLLETGAGPEHQAARALYASEGFTPCPPFGEYRPDPLSVFMARTL
jgi:putative acetyltransferase